MGNVKRYVDCPEHGTQIPYQNQSRYAAGGWEFDEKYYTAVKSQCKGSIPFGKGLCPECMAVVPLRAMTLKEGRKTEKCGTLCWEAKRQQCNCVCEGRCHGKGECLCKKEKGA